MILSELSVLLCVRGVNSVFTTFQLRFKAEFAEADAEIAEKKLSENF